jgi:hypothetical protein
MPSRGAFTLTHEDKIMKRFSAGLLLFVLAAGLMPFLERLQAHDERAASGGACHVLMPALPGMAAQEESPTTMACLRLAARA